MSTNVRGSFLKCDPLARPALDLRGCKHRVPGGRRKSISNANWAKGGRKANVIVVSSSFT